MYGGGFEQGASQFNGGGFMPTQGNAGGGAGSGSAKKSFESRQQTLRAVTIKQLHDALANRVDDSLVIDGKEVANVTIVGRVVSSQESGITFALVVDDGTGSASVKVWISEDENDTDRQRRAELQAGRYVRVHGHIQSFGKNQEIQAFNVRPIQDHNEVTYHFLQCIFQHVHLTKGTGAGAGAPAGMPSAIKTDGPAAGGYGGAPTGGYGGGVPAPGYNPAGGLNAVQQDIMGIFSAPDAQGDAGISIDDVLARAGGRYSVVQVREAVEALQNEGHLYSTIDENHFKTCV